MTAVTVPDLDQDTRNELAPGCDATPHGQPCPNEATHVAHWTGTCDCIGATDHGLYCTGHAALIRWMIAHQSFGDWACITCNARAHLYSVVPL